MGCQAGGTGKLLLDVLVASGEVTDDLNDCLGYGVAALAFGADLELQTLAERTRADPRWAEALKIIESLLDARKRHVQVFS